MTESTSTPTSPEPGGSTPFASIGQKSFWRSFGGRIPLPGLLGVALILYTALSLLYLDWFVDDAGISFTYARNLGNGEGLVLTPGGERVEGYSNPLWVFLLGFYAALGMTPFGVAKGLSFVLGWGTLWGIFRLGKRLVPEGFANNTLTVGGLAALFTALHTPFVIWTQSGLEGPLYLCLMLWGLERLFQELTPEGLEGRAGGSERPPLPVSSTSSALHPVARFPVSSLLFCGVALTRPEGVMFGVLVLGLRWVWRGMDVWRGTSQAETRARLMFGLRQELLALLAFVLPLGLYHLWHYAYFASYVTNTYHVKDPDGSLLERLLNLSSPGWLYVQSWMRGYRLAYTLPLLAVPLGVSLVEAVRESRANSLLSADWVARARWAVLGFLGAAVFFPLYSSGDWMKEYRFLAPAAPFYFLLMVSGVALLVGLLSDVWREKYSSRLYAVLGALAVSSMALVQPAVESALEYRRNPEVGVADVKARGDYFKGVRERLGLKGDVVFMDPDLGATSYYSGMRVIDTWGLSDVPFAMHGNNQAFAPDYVLEEVRPDLIHVFGYWNGKTKILEDGRWTTFYAPLPSYRGRRGAMDGGNYVLRSHLRATPREYQAGAPLRVFGSGLELVHAAFDLAVLNPGGGAILTLFWRAQGAVPDNIMITTRLEGAGLPSLRLDHAPLYGWLTPSQWLPGEVVKERIVVNLPPEALAGEYRLEVGVVDASSGQALPVQAGELRTFPTLRVDGEAATASAAGLVAASKRSLAAGESRQAFEQAELALTLLGAGSDLGRNSAVALSGAVAKVLPAAESAREDAENAWRKETLTTAERLMKEASARQASETFRPAWWRWRTHDDVRSLGERLAVEAFARAEALEQKGAFRAAFEHYLAAITFQPTLAMARQRAERIRFQRDETPELANIADDATWVRSVVLGVGHDGKMVQDKTTFKVGESVMCQTFWSRPDRHLTTWRWYDAQGIMRFKQWQSTGENAGTSFAFINALDFPGQWTVEVVVDNRIAAVRTFEVEASE